MDQEDGDGGSDGDDLSEGEDQEQILLRLNNGAGKRLFVIGNEQFRNMGSNHGRQNSAILILTAYRRSAEPEPPFFLGRFQFLNLRFV